MRVLGEVYRTIAGHLLRTAGFTRTTHQTGAVRLIQRLGSVPNLDINFHMLFLDGAYLFKVAQLRGLEGDVNGAARAGGFTSHAGVGIATSELERLC